MLPRTVTFVDEIRSSLEFYSAQSQGSKVGRVVITGGGSKLEGFFDMLSERLLIVAQPGHVFGKVRPELDMDDAALAEAEPLLATAIGLAVPGERA